MKLVSKFLAILVFAALLGAFITVFTSSAAHAGGNCTTGNNGGGYEGGSLPLDNGTQNNNTPSNGGCTEEEPPAEPPPTTPPPAVTPTPTQPTHTPTHTPTAPQPTPTHTPTPIKTTADARTPRLSMKYTTVCFEIRRTDRGSITVKYGRITVINTGNGAGTFTVNGNKFTVPAKDRRVREIALNKAGSWKATVKLGTKKAKDVSGLCVCPAPKTSADSSNKDDAKGVAKKSKADAAAPCPTSSIPLWIWLVMGLLGASTVGSAVVAHRRKNSTTDAEQGVITTS